MVKEHSLPKYQPITVGSSCIMVIVVWNEHCKLSWNTGRTLRKCTI